MNHARKTPRVAPADRGNAQAQETLATGSPATAIYAMAVVVGCLICWATFLHGFWLTFKDIFGSPPPPRADWFFATAGLVGVAVEVVGTVFLVRSVIAGRPGESSFKLASLLPKLAVALAMLLTMVPLSLIGFALASALADCWTPPLR